MTFPNSFPSSFNEVQELIDRIDRSSLVQFELRLGDAYVRMGKSGAVFESAPIPAPAVTIPAEPPPAPPRAVDAAPAEAPPAAPSGRLVTSPLVGTFYVASAPDKPSFVSIGDSVKKGDVLCIVEAMKVMNEIKSEFDGRVAEVCVENGQMVEFGQSLFRIE